MGKVHLQEIELACSGSGESDASTVEHLRRCAQCRSAAAEYRWLGERVGDVLASVACAAGAPCPKWRVVKKRLADGQQRRITGWRASATAGVALAVCAILSLSSVVGLAVAQASSPEAVMTPALVTAAASDAQATLGATPTPVVSREDTGVLPVPALPSIPTPPEPDA